VLALACVAAVATPFSKTTSNDNNTLTADTVQPATSFGSSTSCVQTATITFVATSNGSAGSAVNKPAGTAQGDVLVAAVQVRGMSSDTITAPTGWNLIRRDSDPNSQVTAATYWKLAGASEPATYTFTTNGGRSVVGIDDYSGVDPSTPINVSGAASGTSAAPAAPSLTTTVANTMLIALATLRQQGASTTPAGMTSRWNQNTAGGANSVGGAGADVAFAGPGATGSKGFTTASSSEWLAQSVAIEPARAPRVSLSWTASSSTWATGYTLERWIGATLDQTFTIGSRATTSYNDDTVTSGTAYTYKIYANYAGSSTTWKSSVASASATAPSC
jgi:hypothetical protein